VLRTVALQVGERGTGLRSCGVRGSGQPRPAFGFVPWFALDVRAFCFFFDVRFDIGMKCYPVLPPISEA
jgi:hypothetical protein